MKSFSWFGESIDTDYGPGFEMLGYTVAIFVDPFNKVDVVFFNKELSALANTVMANEADNAKKEEKKRKEQRWQDMLDSIGN
jgi:hypothetical protein